MSEKTVVIRYAVGGEVFALKVPFSLREEKVRGLYKCGADWVTIRGKLCGR